VWAKRLNGVYSILQDRTKCLSIESVEDLECLEGTLDWFLREKDDALKRAVTHNGGREVGQVEHHSWFLTKEASDDFEDMLRGIIAVTKVYATRDEGTNQLTFFNPRTFSQDTVENSFGALRLGAKHMRLTPRVVHEVSIRMNLSSLHDTTNHRVLKKRNIADSTFSAEDAAVELNIGDALVEMKKKAKAHHAKFREPTFSLDDDGNVVMDWGTVLH
jgi:hypothetical protein